MAPALLALVGAVVVWALPDASQGLRLAYVDGQVVVDSVDYGSAAQRAGLRPGQVVLVMDSSNAATYDVFDSLPDAKADIPHWTVTLTQVMTAPRDAIRCDASGKCSLAPGYEISPDAQTYVYPAYLWFGSSGQPGEIPIIVACVPASGSSEGADSMGQASTCRLASLQLYADLASGGGVQVKVCEYPAGGPGDVSAPSWTEVTCYEGSIGGSTEPDSITLLPRLETIDLAMAAWTTPGMSFGGPPEAFHDLYERRPVSLLPAGVGLAILLLGWLAIGRGRLGSALRPFALTLPVATAVPLIGVTIDSYHAGPATAFLAVLLPAAMLLLAMDFLARIEGRIRRRVVGLVTLGLALVAAAAGLLLPLAPTVLQPLRPALLGGVAFVPGLFAARPFGRRDGQAVASGRSPRALVESFDVLLAALTPGVAAISLAFVDTVEVWPIVLWLALLVVATRQMLRPLARLATSATHQRDLVVAATEAERARIAADIHDDALQDLTMLIRRLEEAGDQQNADAGRGVIDRLRAICGDLRLPVLDDLGVGPALEWLCGRLDSSGTAIRLDRVGNESRLPAPVELAAFRIAQEALANAVRHGDTPIAVRYRARQGWMELDVEDSGRGIADGSAELAEKTGHMGLLNMTQRAEAIEASLEIGRRPEGGTHVRLIWDGTAAALAAPAPEPA